jgi:hypothetical protein
MGILEGYNGEALVASYTLVLENDRWKISRFEWSNYSLEAGK